MINESSVEPASDVIPPRGSNGLSLSSAKLAAFASPGAPISGLTIPLIAYMPNFYATNVGLPLALVGVIFMVVRLLDVGVDPLIGGMMDRLTTRYGRFRPWLVLGAVPLVFASIALFNPPAGAGVGYLTFWLALTYAGYSVCYLSHLSWASALSTDYHGRSRVFGWWQAGMLTGMVVVLLTPILIQQRGGSLAAGIGGIGWLISALLFATVTVALLCVPEPGSKAPSGSIHFGDYVRLMCRPNVARLLVSDILFGIGNGMNAALFIFYCDFLKGFDASKVTILVFLNLLGSLLGTPFWTWLTRRIGKHRASARGFFFYALSLVAIDLMPSNFPVGCVVLFVAGITLSAGPLLLRSMMADAGDEERLRTGKDCTGLLSALFAGTNKLGLAIAPGITFLALGLSDFHPTGPNSSNALLNLRIFYVYIPAVLGFVAAWYVRKHPLTAERHAEIRALLDAAERS